MPSIVPGYEYDIFISYRHNDNRSGWVTEFVHALKQELAATIKEPVSVYFDNNPNDGLLETHNVDKSLEGKLKCLIFIPIISQTYCDPKSFAWQHEFCTFNKLAKEDRFGRDIRLSNGNVASRILPARIHDLDAEDRAIIEGEIGGSLRGIDFTFKSPGINRPLLPTDDREKNQTRVLYRDQLNKTAIAIKELISAIKLPPQSPLAPSTDMATPKKRRLHPAVIVAVIVCFASILFFTYQSLTGRGNEIEDKSIAVLPFVDMSPEKNQEYLGDGLSEDIITALSHISGLKVIGRTSSFQFKGEKIDLRQIGEQLGVSQVLEGSIMRSGNDLRITAQLISVKDGTHIWSERFDRSAGELFAIHDEISQIISNKMKVTMISSSATAASRAITPDAYTAFLQGRHFYENMDSSSNTRAIRFFTQAIQLDSGFALPWTYLTGCYLRKSPTATSSFFKMAEKAAEKALKLDPSMSVALVNMAEIFDNEYDFAASYLHIQQALAIDPDDPYVLRNAGRVYTLLGRFEESESFCLRSLQNDPIQKSALNYLIEGYYYSGQYVKALETIERYEKAWGEEFLLLYFKLSCRVELGESIDPPLQYMELRAIANFRSGKIDEAKAICDQMVLTRSKERAYSLARAFAYGKSKEKSLSWLEKAYSNRERLFIHVKTDPAFKEFHSEPRFQQLVANLKFPE